MTLSLTHHSTPTVVPAGRGGVGLCSAEAVRYEWDPSSPVGQRVLFGAVDHVIEEHDVLEYDVFPAFGSAVVPPDPSCEEFDKWFAATGVCLDLVFSDGSRASDIPLVDHHGVPHSPTDRLRAKTLTVDQWNHSRVILREMAGRRAVGVEIHVAHSDRRFHGWIDGPRFGRAADEPADPVDSVSTLRGTHSSFRRSRGATVPATALPNAFQLLLPVTNAEEASWPYSFHGDVDDDAQPTLEAFAVSHAATPWLGDRGVLHLFPLAEGCDTPEDPSRRRRRFTRANEAARPHEYRVVFDDGTTVRLAPGDRGAIVEICSPFPDPTLLVSLPDPASELELTDGAPPIVRGWSDQVGPLPAGAGRCFYSLTIDAPLRTSRRARSPHGADVLLLTPRLRAGDTLVIRLGTSFVSAAQADENLRQSTAGLDADTLVSQARETWGELLNRVTLTGATPDQRVSFYSALYRLFLYPSIAHEVTAGGEVVHTRVSRTNRPGSPARGTFSVGNGFWDTYRTTWPAYALFDPARATALLQGFVQHFTDDGWMPRWSNPGAVDLMVGTSSDTVFADAASKGIHLDQAWEAALKNATVPADEPWAGRKGQNTGVYVGFVDSRTPEGLSWTMENCLCDAALAQWAADAAAELPVGSENRDDLTAIAEYLSFRSLAYRALFDEGSGYFRGMDERGERSSTPFRARDWGGDYTETNAWGMLFSAPHDVDGLIELHGGRPRFEETLDAYFATPETASDSHVGTYGGVIHEMPEARDIRMGMWALSNQPAHHVPFLYAYTDSPHKTQRITREAVRRCFLGSEIGQGYPGDEDNGEMSAWYIFAALGLYPICPGSPFYVLTSPLFERIEVVLDGARRLVVNVIDQAPENVYIRHLTVNGAPWNSPFIPHSLIAAGAVLEFTLGAKPSEWGRDRPRNTAVPTTPRADAPGAHVSFAGGVALTDNTSDADADIPLGGYVEWIHDRPTAARQYTISAGRSAADVPGGWQLEARHDDQNWEIIDERHGVQFTSARQLRPFTPTASTPARAHRLVFTSPGTASEVELLIDMPTAHDTTTPEER